MKFTPHPARSSGFSLVEITMAIGIIAFAFVALLGMLPTGMTVFRDAMDTSVTAQISQRIAGELQESDFNSVLSQCTPELTHFSGDEGQSGVLPTRYFDDQGNEVTVLDATKPTVAERQKGHIIYDAHTRVTRAPRLPTGLKETAAREPSENLVTLNIQVVGNPGGFEVKLDSERLVDATQKNIRLRNYSALIARSGSR